MTQLVQPLVEGNYEGDVDVPLAPVGGIDERRDLVQRRELFARRPQIFLLKFSFAIALIAAAWAAIVIHPTWPVVALAILMNGLMYAHLVELQHECLHGHAFNSPRVNRLFGVVCGIFMLSSHSHYRYDHLRHHAHLGTTRNKEHFNYRFQNLDSIGGFLRAFFDPSRFVKLIRLIGLSLLWRHLPGIEKASYDRDIKQEYLFYFVLVVASIWWTIQSQSALFLLAWWLPAVLISEGVHFMIEMPEHFGLNTQTDANVLSNTRTIRTSPLVSWFVNGNDIHTAHHYHQGVPMCNVRRLHHLIAPKIQVVESSYLSFYRAVLSGRVKQQLDTTCMTR